METLREYEKKAAVVIGGHGRVIERTVIVEPSEPGKSIREVHLGLASLAVMRVASMALFRLWQVIYTPAGLINRP